MSAPLTLYVVHTDRDASVAEDAIAAARWASAYPCIIVLVVNAGTENAYAECGADLVHGSSVPASGPLADFRFYDGLLAAQNNGLTFEQAICFRDDALFVGVGLDKWAAELFYRDRVDFVSAADRHYYGESFYRAADLLSAWRVPHEIWDRPPSGFTPATAVFCLRAALVKELFSRRLLLPPSYDKWPVPFSCYASWTCHLAMFTTKHVGSMDKPQTPFFINDGWGGAYNAPPHILHPNVLIYWSIRRVAGYGESDLREWAKKRRASK